MKRDVKMWRNTGLFRPHPSRGVDQRRPLVDLQSIAADLPAAFERAEEDQMPHSFRMLRRIRCRDSAALRDAQQVEPVRAQCVHDRLQIANPCVKRESGTCQSDSPHPRSS